MNPQEQHQEIEPRETPRHSMNVFEFILEVLDWITDEDHVIGLYLLGVSVVIPIILIFHH